MSPVHQEDSDYEDEAEEDEGKGNGKGGLMHKRKSGTIDLTQQIIPEEPKTRRSAAMSREDSLHGTFSLKESLHFNPEEMGMKVNDLTEEEVRKATSEARKRCEYSANSARSSLQLIMMIDKEYPDHSSHKSLDIYGCVESVLSTPSKYDTYPNADWSQRNWVEFYGPDQQWHITMVTRIDERETEEDSILPFVEAAILRNTKMLDEEIEKIKNEVIENRKKITMHETAARVLRLNGAMKAFNGRGGGGDDEEEVRRGGREDRTA